MQAAEDVDRRSGGWLLATTAGCALFAYAAGRLSWIEGGHVVAIRLGSAWLLGMLLLRRPSLAATTVAALCGFAAFLLASRAALDEPFPESLSGALVRTAESVFAYAGFRVVRCDPRGLRTLADVGWVALIAAVVTPLLAGAAAAIALEGDPDARRATLAQWWAGDLLGNLALLPFMLACAGGEYRRFLHRAPLLRLTGFGLVALATSLVAVRWLVHPFMIITLPLLLAALYADVLAASLINVLSALASVLLALLVDPHELAGFSTLGPTGVAAYSAITTLAPLVLAVQARQRRIAEQASRRAADELRVVTDNVPVAIGRIDAHGRYRAVNRRLAELLGCAREQAIGQTPLALLGRAYVDAVAAHVEAVRRGEEVRFEQELHGRVYEVHYIPHLDDGNPDGMVLLAIDETDRKRTEQLVFAEKERFRVTLESIADGVVACDNALRIQFINPMAELLAGVSELEALGRPVQEVVRLRDHATGTDVLSPLAVAMRRDRVTGLRQNCVLLRADGRRIHVEDSAAPMHDATGRVSGGVMVFRDVSEARQLALRMSHQAHHDYLTDLPNRILMQDRLERALLAGEPGALLFVDLDNFKNINDSLGHALGDEVLQHVARRLVEAVRPDDTVSRQGGDEFVVLLPRLNDPRDAALVAEKLMDALHAPVEVQGHSLYVGLSIGIALYPQDATDRSSLMRQADAALYHAKHAGKGRFSYFARGMSERAEERLRLENELRAAIDDDALLLVYQPKVGVDGIICGAEALVRWRQHDGSLRLPGEFVPTAEETGLITRLDAWVLHAACRQLREWLDQGLAAGPIAVNVSLARFDADRLLATVASALGTSDVPGDLLEIEFTESQMFADHRRAGRLIDALHALGVRVAIDDFGTGYSNLAYLVEHRFDTIKIDRSFVAGLPTDRRHDAIVQAILRMSHALGAAPIAEGVETVEQATALIAHGCGRMQGYLYSPPVPADAFLQLLERPSLLPETPTARG